MDEFSASRLPDIPNAGYSSYKEKATSDLIMFWLRAIERDRICLLTIVTEGIEKWRRVAGKAWCLPAGGRVGAMSTELLDRVYDYMVRLAGVNPAQQLLTLLAQRHERNNPDQRAATHKETRRQLRAAIEDLQNAGPRLRKR